MSIIDDSFVGFVNMDHRTDRLAHMNAQLSRIDLKAVRMRGMKPDEYTGPPEKIATMRSRTQKGAIGCHFSQIAIWKEAFALGLNACVFEDDVIFCSDFHERMKIITEFTDTHEWDVIWLGASFHVNPPFWHRHGGSGMSPNCSAGLGRDAELTDNPRIVRTYGAYVTFAYIVNYYSIEKIMKLFDQHLHTSIGIDWLFIKLQPQLNCFSFVPGCVMQMDNISDIGEGMTVWSGQLKNGPYVWQDKMSDFDPEIFNWAECRK